MFSNRTRQYILYRRVRRAGRNKYIPESVVGLDSGLPEGHWLVSVSGACRAIKKLVKPAHARVFSAIMCAESAMLKAMQEKSKLGRCRDMSPETEAKGWRAFRKATGFDKPMVFPGASLCDVLDAGIEVLAEKTFGKDTNHAKA